MACCTSPYIRDHCGTQQKTNEKISQATNHMFGQWRILSAVAFLSQRSVSMASQINNAFLVHFSMEKRTKTLGSNNRAELRSVVSFAIWFWLCILLWKSQRTFSRLLLAIQTDRRIQMWQSFWNFKFLIYTQPTGSSHNSLKCWQFDNNSRTH